ncbi:uncharacterized protein L203_102014 [Cryptococcus depauperatus CBS 7841]|uniref:Uncharacterized protein n=1 Tax=Cryptococcus depauperatus CBS 7841 TaxID=1295531 RepID=A0AAJ8JQV9_9TREE
MSQMSPSSTAETFEPYSILSRGNSSSSDHSSTNTTVSSTSWEDSLGSYQLPQYRAEKKRWHYIFTQRVSVCALDTLWPRRRSFLPLIGFTKRKSTQLALVVGILVFGVLLFGEFKRHEERRNLWDQEFKLQERGIRHAADRHVNLAAFRTDYQQKRRAEILERRQAIASGVEGMQYWTTQDEDDMRRQVAEKWPDWWGNPDVVGESPFDYRPVSLPSWKEKKRFLMLTDYVDYLERMNTHTYEIVDAALRHPHLIVDVWGPGWAGYDKSLPLSANVRKRAHRISQLEKSKAEFDERQKEKMQVRNKALKKGYQVSGEEEEIWVKPDWLSSVPMECSDVRFDVVLTISNIYRETDPHLDFLDCGALMVQQLGDCHSLRCTSEWYPQSNNITLSKYAFELPELFEYNKVKKMYPDWEMGLFGYSPDTGNEWDFYPIPWHEKTTDAKVFGFDGSFYPIRTTVTNFLRNLPTNQQPLISRHPHPGYTVTVPQEVRDNPLETYEQNHESYKTHIQLRSFFAKGMREAKVCVFDASLERKMIRKYAQAFLSGCVVASDLPTEQETAISKFIIPLKSTWNINQINSAIQYYIDRPELLQQMAIDAMVYARQYLTTTNKISHILEMADHYREGSRGYEFPYGFSIRCRAYWSDSNEYQLPWCQGSRGLEQ